ncbi:Fic family protein [Faecalicatena contorta]|uniref:Fic/DOC family protein n=1 Tax=Faecalicatena contorta TaxID=39482 RepID=A0A315ZVH2_9FIRM|nr:Fic family protein [Faecalicatena contorta]PWJ48940.1 Fic/DOC family protein [Faecalicatena contorta]SUQ15030.1 Fic/DOC family protein [Faecalicatena contorta]
MRLCMMAIIQFDGAGNVVHMGGRPQFINGLMDDLFNWGASDDAPELIKSCVFHYEIETIHPFEDGNGRMGRLWQTAILTNRNPIFAWIPIETIIHENQEAYYKALAISDKENDSTVLIGKASQTRRYLNKFVSLGILKSNGENKNRTYSLK